MQVEKIENPAGTLTRIDFIRTGDDDFKSEIMAWMQVHYPEINYQKFFARLIEFQHGKCVISMI